MTEKLTPEQFNALPHGVQEHLRSQGLAPDSSPAASTTTAPAEVPDLDAIPNQAGRGPDWLPYDREFDFECVLDQVQHRPPSGRNGPNFYATLSVTNDTAMNAGIMPGTHRALAWYYNPNSYGTEKDKSDASLRRYRDFVSQACGLPEGAPGVNAKSAELMARSRETPSLGIRLRVISTRGGESKKNPGKFYYNLKVAPI